MARVIVGIRDPEPSPALLEAARAGVLGGLLWFRGALGTTVEEAARRIGALRAAWPAGAPCTFAIDEEGGLIQQLDGLRDAMGAPWPRLPSARALGRADDPTLARAHGREIGRRMRRLGLDLALAPVVDLDPGPESPVLGTRCFGDDPERVTDLAMEWLRGLASAGIQGCVKHFPGHGATAVDSHVGLPRVPADSDPGRHRRPYERIAAEWSGSDGPPPAVLTAHLTRGEATLPASLDPAVVAEIPGGLGPVLTDSLDMGALEPFGDLARRGRFAVDAGSDLLIVGLDPDAGIRLARSLTASGSSLIGPRRGTGRDLPPIPPTWERVGIDRVSEAAFRLLIDTPIPEGDWTWILPDRYRAYGPIAEPAATDGGRRRIARIVRYAAEDARSLASAIARGGTPSLVGWIHRGPPADSMLRPLREAAERVRAIAHLLDGPARPLLPGVWTAETCGFGEGEVAALVRAWSEAPPIPNAR